MIFRQVVDNKHITASQEIPLKEFFEFTENRLISDNSARIEFKSYKDIRKLAVLRVKIL